MGYLGARSKETITWMLRQDASHFGELIADEYPDARWRCSQPGPADRRYLHLHLGLGEALDCGGVQALLPLPIGSNPTEGQGLAIIQFLESDVMHDDLGSHLRAGRLATTWNELDVGPTAHEIMTAERDRVWRILRAAAKPAHVEDLSGKPLTGARIGAEAEARVNEDRLLLSRMGGFARFRLRR